jgi:hypothetical protein
VYWFIVMLINGVLTCVEVGFISEKKPNVALVDSPHVEQTVESRSEQSVTTQSTTVAAQKVE